MSQERAPVQRLPVRLLKSEITRVDAALEDPRGSIAKKSEVDWGLADASMWLRPNQSPPLWLQFVQTGRAVARPARTSAGRSIVRGAQSHSVYQTAPAAMQASSASSPCPASLVTVTLANSVSQETEADLSRLSNATLRPLDTFI